MNYTSIVTAFLVLSAPAQAQDASLDADAGETLFSRQCVVCHVIEDDGGEVLAGRSARTGPNLYGVIGMPPGSRHDFDYSESLVAYGESGVTWGVENLVPYLQDPTAHLRDALDDPSARSKMSFKLRDADDAADVYAYLSRFAADEGETPDNDAAEGSQTGSDDEKASAASDDIAADLDAGEALYQGSCRNCHGPDAQGMASFPLLAGKEMSYLKSRLEQYRDGESVGPNSAIMYPVARELSDEDIVNVSAFIASIE